MSDWISVKERVPEDGQKVIVFLRSGYQCVGEFCKTHGFTNDVTHWQPQLPPPPQPDAFLDWWMAWGGDKLTCTACNMDNARVIWTAAIASVTKEKA